MPMFKIYFDVKEKPRRIRLAELNILLRLQEMNINPNLLDEIVDVISEELDEAIRDIS